MAWIKDFRKARGLSQVQLARFAGISRTYLSVLELRPSLPDGLNTLFLDLQTEFDRADAVVKSQEFVSPPHKTNDFTSALEQRLVKKREQLKGLQRRLGSLEKRYRQLLLLRQVCERWRSLKKDTDPTLEVKLGALEAGQKTELRRCGPAARAEIRIRIACLEAEIEMAAEELKFFSNGSV